MQNVDFFSQETLITNIYLLLLADTFKITGASKFVYFTNKVIICNVCTHDEYISLNNAQLLF